MLFSRDFLWVKFSLEMDFEVFYTFILCYNFDSYRLELRGACIIT